MTLFQRALFHAGDANLGITTSIESGVQKLITGPKPIIENFRTKGTSFAENRRCTLRKMADDRFSIRIRSCLNVYLTYLDIVSHSL